MSEVAREGCGLWAVVCGLAIVAIIGARRVAAHRLERALIKTHPQGPRTPATLGLAFENLRIDSGGRTLHAFYVAPPAASLRPLALLIFHGNGESISGWVPVQKFLADRGVGSMVFDYSGFGMSSGTPSLAHLHQDGLAAWSAFRARLPKGTRACAYGLSLGSGVLLEDAPELRPVPDCLIVYGAFVSALGAAVQMGRLSPLLAALLPDALESERNAARAPAPLLVEYGESDQLFPIDFARRIAARAKVPRLVIVPGHNHAQPLVAPDDAAWAPVLEFARGTAPGSEANTAF